MSEWKAYGLPSLPRTTPLGSFFGGSAVVVVAVVVSGAGLPAGCGSVLSAAILVRRGVLGGVETVNTA